jgi:isopenicillin N synthase-like dioxygenase
VRPEKLDDDCALMSTANARTIDPDTIPIVDIGPLRDGSDSKGVAQALHAASKGLGFIYIQGHGIPDDVIAAARASAFDFFRAPAVDKETVRISSRHRGWIGVGGVFSGDTRMLTVIPRTTIHSAVRTSGRPSIRTSKPMRCAISTRRMM